MGQDLHSSAVSSGMCDAASAKSSRHKCFGFQNVAVMCSGSFVQRAVFQEWTWPRCCCCCCCCFSRSTFALLKVVLKEPSEACALTAPLLAAAATEDGLLARGGAAHVHGHRGALTKDLELLHSSSINPRCAFKNDNNNNNNSNYKKKDLIFRLPA